MTTCSRWDYEISSFCCCCSTSSGSRWWTPPWRLSRSTVFVPRRRCSVPRRTPGWRRRATRRSTAARWTLQRTTPASASTTTNHSKSANSSCRRSPISRSLQAAPTTKWDVLLISSPLRIDPNCSQYWLAQLLSFERSLLSVDVSLCLCVGNFDAKISETKLFRDSCPIGALLYRKVPTARRLLASSMTSSDYDVILVPSQYSKSTHSENRSRIHYFSRIFKCTL